MQQAESATDGRRGNIAHDAQHARRARVRGREPGARVEQTRPGHDHTHANVARRSRVTVRHVCRCLFVTRVHVRNVIGDPGQAVDSKVELNTWHAEDMAHALAHQLCGECVPAAHGDRSWRGLHNGQRLHFEPW